MWNVGHLEMWYYRDNQTVEKKQTKKKKLFKKLKPYMLSHFALWLINPVERFIKWDIFVCVDFGRQKKTENRGSPSSTLRSVCVSGPVACFHLSSSAPFTFDI